MDIDFLDFTLQIYEYAKSPSNIFLFFEAWHIKYDDYFIRPFTALLPIFTMTADPD